MNVERCRRRLEAAENATNVADVIAWATGPARADMRLALDVIEAVEQMLGVTEEQDWDRLEKAFDAFEAAQ